MQKRLFGGCHLTRPVVDLLTAAGFTIIDLDVFYEKGAPKVVGADSLGAAVSPVEVGAAWAASRDSVPAAETPSGLSPGTTYHYRIVASNAGGATGGADRTFTTAEAIVVPPPATPSTTPTSLLFRASPQLLGKAVNTARDTAGQSRTTGPP